MGDRVKPQVFLIRCSRIAEAKLEAAERVTGEPGAGAAVAQRSSCALLLRGAFYLSVRMPEA